MPTVLTFAIAPSGGDYTSLTACRAANAKNLVTADESHVYEFHTFSGGLADNDALVGYTTDATRTLTLKSADGHAWDMIDPESGFYFNNASVDTIRPVSSCNDLIINGISFVGGRLNLSTVNGGMSRLQVIDCVISNNVSGDALVFSGGSARPNASISGLLIINAGDDAIVGEVGTIDKVTIVNASNRGFVITGGVATNLFVYGSTGVDFSIQGGSVTYCASSDATASGTGSLISRTSADFSDYAGGDYRTAAASALATAGSGGTYMGFAVEAASGISITESTASYGVTSTSPTVTLTGSISIIESTANYNITSLNPLITLTGVISIVESTANYNYTSNNPTIDFTGLVSIDEQLVNVNYQSQNPTITLTSHAISITESTASYQVDSFNPAILLTPEPIGIVSTLCFNGKLFSLESNGTVKEIGFNGGVSAIEFNAELQEIIFNGLINTQENNGYLKDLEFNGTIQTNC